MDELEHDQIAAARWGRNYVGSLKNFKRSYLKNDFTKVNEIIDPLFLDLWNTELSDSPYQTDAFRVIEPTTQSVNRAIAKWCEDDKVPITLEMYEFVCTRLPELRNFPCLCEIRDTSPLDYETFCVAIGIWLDMMEQYKAPQRGLNDPDIKFVTSTVAGPVYAAENIKTKYDGVVVPYLLTFI